MPVYFVDDPVVVLTRAEQAFYTPGAPRPDLGKVEAAARQALASNPLDPRALHLLGVVHALRGKGDGVEAFLLAEKVSRRSIHNEIALASHYAQQNDLKGLIVRMDRVFSVEPGLVEAYSAGFAESFGDPVMVQALKPYAYRPWFLAMIGLALDNKQPVASISALIDEAERQQPKDEVHRKWVADLRIRLLGNILTSGDYASAQIQLQRLPLAKRAALEKLGFLPENTDPALAPMAWTLANDTVKSAMLESDGTLQVSVRAEQSGVVADRMTILRPGNYQLRQVIAYNDSDPQAGLLWDVTCEGVEGLALWHQPMPIRRGKTTYQTGIAVPANCPVQHWFLRANGDLGQSESLVSINALLMVAQ